MYSTASSRREFIYKIGIAAAGICQLRFNSAGSKMGTCVVPYTRYKNSLKHYGVLLLDLDTGKLKNIKTDKKYHKACANPLNSSIFACSPQISDKLFLWNFKNSKLLKSIKNDSGYYFYGHYVFDPNGKNLFATSTNIDDEGGYTKFFLTKINISSGEIKDHIFLGTKAGWHDCSLTPDKQSIITAGGSEVVFIDIKSGVVSRKIQTQKSSGFLNHLAIFKNGNIALQKNVLTNELNVSKTSRKFYNGKIVVINGSAEKNSEIRSPLWQSETGDGQLFGVIFSPDGKYIAVNVPFMNKILFLDFKSKKVLQHYNINTPHGMSISLNKKYFVATTLDGIKYYSVSSLKPIDNAGPSFLKEFESFFENLKLPSHFSHSEIVNL